MGVEINKIADSHHEDKDDNYRKLKKSKANVQHGGDGNMNQQSQKNEIACLLECRKQKQTLQVRGMNLNTTKKQYT